MGKIIAGIQPLYSLPIIRMSLISFASSFIGTLSAYAVIQWLG